MLFDAIFAADVNRSPDSDFWYTPLVIGGARRQVSADQALTVSAVFACVRVISETLGSLPCITYRRQARGKERATDHPLYPLLRYAPNDRQTAIEFFEMMTAHCALRGNAYAAKVYRGGRLEQLVPLHPDHMRVDLLDNGRLGYLYTSPVTRQPVRYLEDEILHLRGLSLDGLTGVSVLSYAARTIGSALSADEYGSRFFENDATPGGILTHPSHFADRDKREAFKRAWQAAQSGTNRGKTAVLEDGMKFEQIGMTNADAQYIESRRWGVEDICRIFRVPLVLVGETTKSTSWGSGVEQFMISFITHTMRPWFVRWEQVIQRDFLADESPDDEYFVEFLAEALLRGDTAARAQVYEKALQHRWMTPNEVRERENMNPIEGGDDLAPPIDAPAPRGTPPSSSPSPVPDDPEDDVEETGAERVIRKEAAAMRRLVGRGATLASVQRFFGTHAAYVQEQTGVSEELAARYCADRAHDLCMEWGAKNAGVVAWNEQEFKAKAHSRLAEVIEK